MAHNHNVSDEPRSAPHHPGPLVTEEYPTTQQKAVIWGAATALSWVVILAIIGAGVYLGLMFVGLMWPVLLPVGVAGVVAFLLDPAVEALVKRGYSRAASIWILLALVALVGSLLLLYIVPPLVKQIMEMSEGVPKVVEFAKRQAADYLAIPELNKWVADHSNDIQTYALKVGDTVFKTLGNQVQQIIGWFGFAIGFLFVPILVFYFLIEKEAISENWTTYLPLHRSWWREEVVIVLREINYYLVIFFRGQVVVAIIVGLLTALGLQIIGLKYALIVGMMAGILGIIPFFGIATSLIAGLAIAYLTTAPGDALWLMPLKVIIVFSVVQFAEGFFITPRIMGEATGLHPAAVMISILVWSIILPGFLGPILAIPFTATLRVLMFRYIWLHGTHDGEDADGKNAPPAVVLADGSPATQRVALVPVKKALKKDGATGA